MTLAQLASATVLLVGAGLLLASLASLARVAPGFTPERIVTMQIVLPRSRYDDPGMSKFFREIVAGAARLPGVEAAAGISHLPLDGSNSTESYTIEGRPQADPNEIPEAPVRAVTPGYFATMRIPFSAGRDFTPRDTASSAPVVVVNRAFARQLGSGTEAVGRRIFMEDLSGRRIAWEIVGIVGDVRASSLGQAALGEIYVCDEQRPYDALTLTLRTSAAPAAIAASVRGEVARLDPDQPVSEARTMESFVAGSIAQPRLTTALLAAFAGLALLIAGVGLFSLIAYSVGERRREIGVRVALGARPFDVVRLVVGEAAVLAAAGLAAGLAIAAAATRALSSLLFGIGPRDPRVFAASAAILAAIALAASLVPAARAARIPPNEALRAD